MADELQQLIERIRTEAVDTGKRQADDLAVQAASRAAETVREAEARAKAILEQAAREADAFRERGRQTLANAARDLLLTVGEGVERIVGDLAREAVDAALDENLLREMLVKVVEAHAARGAADSTIEVLLAPQERERVAGFLAARFAERLRHGVELKADGTLARGFRLGLEGGRVQHDFSREAIAEALAGLLRPRLAEIVREVALDVRAPTAEDKA